ncbi:MAG TPA: FAD-binding oxidoreductase [Desulfobacteraceae bacterium]|nr:FAD-binding oxidoreductase [Deltaproteobacteria bacterium]RLB97222.1 MAG: FAD-binding oxidoreductase [Deltaproteobacteria bacterium]HDI60840.1 FAD-binding oxidoreductase [Desulfobacteraceae bacterium]
MSASTDFVPPWRDSPPRPGSYRAIFKWGAPNGFKHPNPRLYRLLKTRLGMADQDFSRPRDTGDAPVRCASPCGLNADQVEALARIVGEANIADDDFSRVRYGTGQSLEEAIRLRRQDPGPAPDLVVHPRHADDVRAVVAFCHQQRIPLRVYGGGSSVTLGLQAVGGGVTLAMATHMHRILAFNETNRTVTVEPGILGPDYERALNEAPARFGAGGRYTGGHFPQSFEYSTVGGWIAALGAGQQSSYYGNIADLVVSQHYVTPAGEIRTLPYPAAATGPKVNDMLKGSEGCFGVMVAATLKIFRHQPENRRRFSFLFPSWSRAVAAARAIAQGEFGLPSVLRISDAEETDVALKLYGIDHPWLDRLLARRGLVAGRRCLMLGQADGQRDFAANIRRQARRIARRWGGFSLTGYPVSRWAHGRFTDPYLREDLADFGIAIDTLETAVPWDRLERVYRQVRSYIKQRPETICMTHASHFYPQGTNLYFIFITRPTDLADFTAFHRGIVARIAAAGGSLSHHHGVGRLMAPWMETHLGTEQMAVLRALKRHFDPHGIMNPGGTLGLDEKK